MTGGVPIAGRSNASSSRGTAGSSAPILAPAITLNRAFALAKEAGFLWTSRSFVARSSASTFAVLASLDDRLSTLISALSKRPGLAEHFLQNGGTPFVVGHTFITAVVAVRNAERGVFEALVTRLDSEPELLSPLASALAWLEYTDVRSYLESLLTSSAPSKIRLGIVAAVAHRVSPGVTLERALDSEDSQLRSTALEAVGRLGAVSLHPRLGAALEDDDVACRFWAAWAAVRFGDGMGIPLLGRFAADCGAFAKPACDIVLRALEPERAVRAQARLLSTTGNVRLGVLAAGIIGDPSLADWLLNQMDSESLARPAAAAFCLMTGRDLRRNDLDADGPPDAASPTLIQAGTTENEDAAIQASSYQADALADEVDDDLAWPDTARLRHWWNQSRHAFVPGSRYLAGAPIRPAELADMLRNGNQQQREAAALELALLNPDAPLLDVRGPAHRQLRASPSP